MYVFGLQMPDLFNFTYFDLHLAESSPPSGGVGGSGGGVGAGLRRLGNWGSSEGSTLILTQEIEKQ